MVSSPSAQSNVPPDKSGWDSLAQALSIIKLIFEIIAIPIAAVWAYYHFSRVDEPELLPRLQVKTELEWIPAKKPTCLAGFTITIVNSGKQNIQVDSVRYLVRLTRFTKTSAKIQDLNVGLDSMMVVADVMHRSSQQIGLYEPDAKGGAEYLFFVKPPIDDFITFSAEVYFHATVSGRVGIMPAHQSGWPCGSRK